MMIFAQQALSSPWIKTPAVYCDTRISFPASQGIFVTAREVMRTIIAMNSQGIGLKNVEAKI